ncbi:NAD(P)/FAD-dependent oxidoreductase [Paraburkholderia megapolitana]|uniref:NAD(P)/FAD-dependent oxidoreductase n=1 Tax=Paraburkholderia megapolitana TaxID=420953 RepID=UPI0038BAF8F5
MMNQKKIMMNCKKVVVVGAGVGGAGVALALRSAGYQGELTLIGEEQIPPYDRPPLSKGILTGAVKTDQVFCRKRYTYAAQNIDLRLGMRVEAFDIQEQRLKFSDAEPLSYDALVIATGARPKRLPGITATDTHVRTLRTLDDAMDLKAELLPGRHIVVIGGGVLGLEVAASARRLGCRVTVIELADQLLARVVPPVVGSFFAELHRAQGTSVLTGRRIASISAGSAPNKIVLDDGSVCEADVILAAIGATPNDELARAAGISIDDGVITDICGHSSIAGIWAVGDVARISDEGVLRARYESVAHTSHRARVVAVGMLGHAAPVDEPMWFWSDQHNVKLQGIGLTRADDELVVVGSPREGSFATYAIRENRIVAVTMVNRMRDFLRAKQMVAQGAPASQIKQVTEQA